MTPHFSSLFEGDYERGRGDEEENFGREREGEKDVTRPPKSSPSLLHLETPAPSMGRTVTPVTLRAVFCSVSACRLNLRRDVSSVLVTGDLSQR